MSRFKFENSEKFVEELDSQDSLAHFREFFHIPKTPEGREVSYFAGNSLGLQPKNVSHYVNEVLRNWAEKGVEGHFSGKQAWFTYAERLSSYLARLVGAKPEEVIVMNSLTLNLQLMLASFYRPTSERFQVLMEANAFPSDQYAVSSHVRFRGFDPKQAMIELRPREGEFALRKEDILNEIQKRGSQIALILLGNVNYLSGQAFDLASITRAGHEMGCHVGFDLAHAVGNLELHLHDSGADFAVWCHYKYVNAGPGAVAGCFIHERHFSSHLDSTQKILPEIPRLAGWWGNHPNTRFEMKPVFDPAPGAAGWQLSTPLILSMAPLAASMEIFEQISMPQLRLKSIQLSGYLEFLLDQLPPGYCQLITPRGEQERGCQLSIRILGKDPHHAKNQVKKWITQGMICDYREPGIIRIAPVPLYNRFSDVYRVYQALKADAESSSSLS